MTQAVRVSVRLGAAIVGEDGGRVDVSAPTPRELPPAVELDPERVHALRHDVLTENGGLRGCMACGHPELFTRKDFPRALGIGIVVAAALLAPFTWYASLAVAALLDLVLFRLAPSLVQCYVCGSEHRGFPTDPRHPAFDREIDERLEFGEKAVMGKAMREGGTAGAPEPEH